MPIITISFPLSEPVEDAGAIITGACEDLEVNISVRNLQSSPLMSDGDMDVQPEDDDEEEDEELTDEDDDDEGEEGPVSECDYLICIQKSGLRGVFMHLRQERVSLALATPASAADYRLLCYLGTYFRGLTGHEPEIDKDNIEHGYLPGDIFKGELLTKEWLLHCGMMDYARLMMHAGRGSMPVVFPCFNFQAVIGPRLMSTFKLYPIGNPNTVRVRSYGRMMSFLASMQWMYAGEQTTASGRCMVRRFSDPDEQEAMMNNDFTGEDAQRIIEELSKGDKSQSSIFTISAIPMCGPDSEIPAPQLITYGSLLSFLDTENQEQMALVPFSVLPWLVKDVPGSFIDELQYRCDKPLDPSDVAGMLNEAQRYCVQAPFPMPTFPGMGLPVGQRSYIFFWRPGVNGMPISEFRHSIPRLMEMSYSWNISEYSEAKIGDRFYMVCVSPRMPKGIVMSGILVSNPYLREDGVWAVELRPNLMMDPRHPALITLDLLADAIPDFDWQNHVSGRQLDERDAITVEELWAPELEHVVTMLAHQFWQDKTVNAVYPEESVL